MGQRRVEVGAHAQGCRQRMARQVGAVVACGLDLLHLPGIAAPQQHVVARRQGDGHGSAPGAGAQDGDFGELILLHGTPAEDYRPQTSETSM